jgi:acylphosphatase
MDMTPSVQIRIVVRGRVQGVYFRASLQQKARQHGVQGWVRNLPDGNVEAVLSGARDAIDAVVAWAHHGPRGARVEAVDVTPDSSPLVGADFAIQG